MDRTSGICPQLNVWFIIFFFLDKRGTGARLGVIAGINRCEAEKRAFSQDVSRHNEKVQRSMELKKQRIAGYQNGYSQIEKERDGLTKKSSDLQQRYQKLQLVRPVSLGG